MMIFDKLKIEIVGKTGHAAPFIRDPASRYEGGPCVALSEDDVRDIMLIVNRAEREREARRLEAERDQIQRRLREIDAILGVPCKAADAVRAPGYPVPGSAADVPLQPKATIFPPSQGGGFDRF